MMDNESNELLLPVEGFGVSLEDSSKEEKKNRKGLLNWFKLRVCQLCSAFHLGLKMFACQYWIDSILYFCYSFTTFQVEYQSDLSVNVESWCQIIEIIN
jgi:hypothetical protein